MVRKKSKIKLRSSISWTVLGQLFYYFIVFGVNVFLTRFLSPADFGTIGICMFFIGVSNVIIEGGMGGALIRKDIVTKEDYSSLFVYNLVLSLFFFVLILLLSNSISQYYKIKVLKEILPTLGLIFFINTLTYNQEITLIKEMRFKEKSVYRLFSVILASLISIFGALSNLGVWSLVLFQIFNSGIYMMIVIVKVRIIPSLSFDLQSFKVLFSFGFYTTMASILSLSFENIYQLIIGKYWGLSQAGFYYQSKKIQDAVEQTIRPVILNVFYSYLSKSRENPDFGLLYNKIFRLQAIAVALVCTSICFFSDAIIELLYGVKWIESALYLKLLVVTSFFILQELVLRNIFKVFNKVNRIFYIELGKNIVHFLLIVYFTINGLNDFLLYGLVINSFVGFFGMYFAAKKLNKVNYEPLIIIIKIIVSSGFSYLVINYVFNLLKLAGGLKLLLLPIYIILFIVAIVLIRLLTLKDANSVFKLMRNDK